MTFWASVGLSSYPDLRGQEQFTNSQRIADQFWSLATDMQQYLPKGYRLSVNEARRSRPRQSYLWNNRAALGVVVAAPFTSRHDEVTHGNAMDIGVTLPDGTNTALSDENFDRMHTIAERRGFTWQGRYFGEPWHIEGATRKEVLPPYPNARAVADAEYLKYNTTPPTPDPVIPEDDMTLIYIETPTPTSVHKATGVPTYSWLWNPNPTEKEGGLLPLNARQKSTFKILAGQGVTGLYAMDGVQPPDTLDGYTFRNADGTFSAHPKDA